MIEKIHDNIYKIIIVILYIPVIVIKLILLLLILIIVISDFTKFKQKIEYRDYPKDLEYYNDYYIENENEFECLVDLLNKYEVKYVYNKKRDLPSENYEQNTKKYYFYSEKEIEKDDLNTMSNFLERSKIEELFKFPDENKKYYRFFIIRAIKYGIFYEYCSNDCDFQTREIITEKYGNEYKNNELKINNQWVVEYSENY